MNTNISPKGASALAGLTAAVCCSLVWLGSGLIVLIGQGGVA